MLTIYHIAIFNKGIEYGCIVATVEGPNTEEDRATSTKIKLKIHNESSGFFTGIGCFICNFSLKVKEDTKLYQASPRCKAYALKVPFRIELKRLNEQQIVVLLGVDEQLNGATALSECQISMEKCSCSHTQQGLKQTLIHQIHKGKHYMLYYICYMTKIYSRSYPSLS